MIPFASQRGLGQDLAAHLQNEHDNEYMEVAELRGAIAQDLHGAFAEWEVQAKALTRCRNYLYSLSVNPDPRQGSLTRDQYRDYIDRIEDRLGLAGQPRAIVFHIKDGREHCHVVWSRIDAVNEKAVQMAFDHDKLMMVTREFARDHGLTLPDGYHKGRGQEKNRQLSLYEQHQRRSTGLTKEQRMDLVTDAWRASDTPAAFVQALSRQGYILATGKRPYVLIDIYGEMNALPRLIDDKRVRAKDIRAFLEKDFPPESLPTVEEAGALAARHRKNFEAHRDHEQKAEALAQLGKAQAQRRQKVEEQQRVLRQRQHREQEVQASEHRAARDAQRSAYLAQVRAIKAERRQEWPQGLTAILGRFAGIELIRKYVHKYQDRRRLRAFLGERGALQDEQAQQRRNLLRRHELQALDVGRKARALDQIDKREQKSLEESLRTDQRIAARGGKDRMPALNLDLKPKGRSAVPHKAQNRHRSVLAKDLAEAAQKDRSKDRQVDLAADFARAAGEGKSGDQGRGSSDGPKPASRSRSNRRRQRRRNRDKGRER
jgi:hypothetical protein